MKNPSAPKRIMIIGLIAGILGIIGHFTCSDFVGT
jgi:amino acid transporter